MFSSVWFWILAMNVWLSFLHTVGHPEMREEVFGYRGENWVDRWGFRTCVLLFMIVAWPAIGADGLFVTLKRREMERAVRAVKES